MLFIIEVSDKCSSSPLDVNSESTLTLTSSFEASCRIKSFSLSTLFKSSGKSIDIISDQSDSTGVSGQPTSDIDFILISIFSLDYILKSN